MFLVLCQAVMLTKGWEIGLVADFASRLSFGLALVLLLAPWREIRPQYFRTMCLVLLGLAVLAAFDLGFGAGKNRLWITAVAAAALAYVGAVAWGLGLVRLGQLALAGIVLASVLVQARWGWRGASLGAPMALEWAVRAVSGFLLGSTLAAMLLGHHYLIAPAMSIEPLKRMIAWMALALLVRGLTALLPAADGAHGASTWWLLVSMRWGFGIFGPALGVLLAWRTASIRSTQSATGILYATTTLVFLGELSSLVFGRMQGLV